MLSDRHAAAGGLAIEGYEMLKGLEGVVGARAPRVDSRSSRTTRTCRGSPRGSARRSREHPACHAFLLRRHGLYTWGETLPQAVRHVEIVEFLLEAVVPFLKRADEALVMAIVKIPYRERPSRAERDEVRGVPDAHGIDYERWTPDHPRRARCDGGRRPGGIRREIEALKARGGYVTADVIDVRPDTPNLDAMLARFSREHWHDEDEVRFIVEGRGLFHVHPPGAPVFAIEVEAGDLIRVPRGTHHWFDLCADRRIRAIRLFQDPSGWTPHYTDSGVDQGFQPVCFGRSYLSPQPAARE